MKIIIQTVLLLTLVSQTLLAETSITGSVKDLTTGYAIPNVAVTCSNGQVTHTNPMGVYLFENLGSGVFSFTFSKAGYENVIKNGIFAGSGQVLNIQMSPPCILNIVTNSFPPASVNVPYNPVVEVNCHTEPFVFSIVSGSLPPGLELHATNGNIFGTPSKEGSFTFQIGVTDALNNFASKEFIIMVTRELSFTTDSVLPFATQWQPYAFSFEVTNGSLPYVFSLVSGFLPKGFFLSQNGKIGGAGQIVETFDNTLSSNWERNGDVLPVITNGRLAFDNLAQNQKSILRLNVHTTQDATVSFDYETRLQSSDSLTFFIDQLEIIRFSDNQIRSFNMDGLSEGIHTFQWIFNKNSPAGSFSSAWLDKLDIKGIDAVPMETGSSDMRIRVNDAEGRSCSKDFHITVLPQLRVDKMILTNGIIGKTYSQQFSASGGQLPLTWQIYYGHPPEGLLIDSQSGQLHGIPQETSYGTLIFAVTDAANRMAYLDCSLQVVAPLELISTRMPDAKTDELYSEAIITKGGLYPLTFSMAGQMPEGLTINTQTGVIQGKALRTGIFNMKVTVVDQNLPVPQTATQNLQIKIQNSLTILSSAILPRSQKNAEITPVILQAAGGKQPYVWSVVQGTLPGNVNLDANTGIISGAPSDKGDANFDIQVTDQNGEHVQKSFIWYISDSLSIATGALADAVKGVDYEQIIQGKGGYPPYYWRIKSGALLTGLSFNSSTGVISGTPTQENELRSFTIEISDSDTPSQKASRTFTMQVLPQSLYIITSDLPLARVNQAYNQLIRAGLGTPPYHFRIKSGVLPDGLELIDDPQTAKIQGKPLKTGEFYFNIAVSDESLPPNHAEKTFKLDVQGNLEIVNAQLKQACNNQYYSDRIVAINGTLPYSFQLIEGLLPDQIQLNTRTGDITGMSNLNPSNYATFKIKVTDAGKPVASDEKTFFIYGRYCALSIEPKNLPQASVMMTYELTLTGKGGIAPYNFYLDSGKLPSGLDLAKDGSIKGIPETQGSYSFMIRMSDASGNMAQQAYITDVIGCETCPNISGVTKQASGGAMSNVTLIFRDANQYTRTTITDANGDYNIIVPTGWSGTVKPEMQGYSFEPSNRTYQQLMENQRQQNYVANIEMFHIAGKVTQSDTGAGISDIILKYGDAGAHVQTDNQGGFNIDVPFGWSGIVTPENRGYKFEPQSIQIDNIKQSQTNQNFSAISTYVPQLVMSPMSVIFKKTSTARTEPEEPIIQEDTKTLQSGNNYQTGLIIPESVNEYWKTHQPDYRYRKRSNIPSKLDWSQYDSPVRDQGACGSCWAFAGVALLENLANKAKLVTSIDLSEQVMVSCVYKDRSTGGCDGGWYWDVFDYTFRNSIPSESCFPYKATNGNCNNQCEKPEYRLKLTNFTPAHGLWEKDFNVQDIKGALQDGPLSVAFYVPSSFYSYKGGIYDYKSGSKSFGHAVLLVGYDDETQCFRAKNSWGKSWGEDGYFRIAYNDTADIKFGCYACLASGVYLENHGETITFENTGTGNLNINKISSDKTWLSFEPQSIATILPGKNAQISVFVKDWSMISGIDQAVLTVHSNDAMHSVMEIKIEAMAQAQELRPILSVSPPFQDGIWIENEIIHIQTPETDGQVELLVSNSGISDMSWSVENKSSWLSIEKGATGTNSGIIRIAHKSNAMLCERIAEVSIIASGAVKSPQIVRIHQTYLPGMDLNGNMILDITDIVQMLKILAGIEINSNERIQMSDVIKAFNRVGN